MFATNQMPDNTTHKTIEDSGGDDDQFFAK